MERNVEANGTGYSTFYLETGIKRTRKTTKNSRQNRIDCLQKIKILKGLWLNTFLNAKRKRYSEFHVLI